MIRPLHLIALATLMVSLAGCGGSSGSYGSASNGNSSSGSSSQAGNAGSGSYSSSSSSGSGPCSSNQWIGNRRSHVLHPPGGSNLPAPRNQVCFSSQSAGEAAGYHLSGSSGGYTSSRHHSGRRHRHGNGSGYGSGSSSAGGNPSAFVPGPTVLLAARSKTSGCQVRGKLPDPACTPGAVFKGVTAKQICVLGYSRSVRNVSYDTKRTAYSEYGITSHAPGQYEVDHLVSLELGGSNSIANLWPEAASPTPGFHQKDMVENYLHDQVCSGKVSLSQAQHEIATNWMQIYNTMPK